MNLLNQLRNELAKKLGQTAADVASDSVDHCSPEAKRAIEKSVEKCVQKLLDPDDHENPMPTDPNEPLVFRSENHEKSFHIEVKGLSGAWQDIQKNSDLDKALKDNVQIKAEWIIKF
mgnify:CR=1 FL=1